VPAAKEEEKDVMVLSRILALAAVAATAIVVAACGGDDSSSSGGGGGGGDKATGRVGVVLPDAESSGRWVDFDEPLLKAAFKREGLEVDIQNAQNDKAKFATIAEAMINSGVKVLLLVNLDSPSAAAIQEKAKTAGVKTIDYDRLTLGGSADYYVSFDNTRVGEEQGKSLVKCLGDTNGQQIISIAGSPTDNNATLFHDGAMKVLKPLVDDGKLQLKGDKATPDWDNAVGGRTFEQLLTANSGKVDGVLAANDGLANAVIQVLKRNKLKVPVTGQDATIEGLQNILRGDQCVTIYKAIKKEADAAASLSKALITGEKGETNGTVKDTEGNRDVPSVLLTPQPIYKDNMKIVIDDDFITAEDLCTKDVADECQKAGLTGG
jgi:ABC-type xylose transport system substrate-binding protein